MNHFLFLNFLLKVFFGSYSSSEEIYFFFFFFGFSSDSSYKSLKSSSDDYYLTNFFKNFDYFEEASLANLSTAFYFTYYLVYCIKSSGDLILKRFYF